jgi:branched-chain amino acid transport system permease protein
MTETRAKQGLLLIGIAFALAVPFFFSPFRVSQFTLVIAYAVAVLGLNLLVGYNGQISLGHGAFFAIGAYTAALLIEKGDVHYLLTVPAAALVCFGCGLAFGIVALRLRGLYLALVTLGLAIAVPQLIKRFDELTEGSQGVIVSKPTAPSWLPLADDQFLYLITLLIAGVFFYLAWNLTRGQLGRAIVAIRDNEIPARTLGIGLTGVKTGVFAISAAYAGIGGALYVFAIGFAAPESFTIALSFGFLAAIVIGGLATIGGAIFGALFIQFVPEWAGDVDEALVGMIYGGVLMLFMFVLPGGAASLGRRIWRPIGNRFHAEEGAGVPVDKKRPSAAVADTAGRRRRLRARGG